MTELTLDDLTSYPKFQESDLDAKFGVLDNFSNSMFQEGKLDEARKAQEYRTQLEVDTLVSSPTAQVLSGVNQALTGQNSLEFSIGTEAYDRINKGYSDRVGALMEPGNILQVNPGEYVYTRPNPFGEGALVEYDGGSKFISAVNPRSIKQLLADEKLPAIKKDTVFDSLVDKIAPVFDAGDLPGINTAQELYNDPDYQALPIEDQRMAVRQFRLNRNALGDEEGVLQSGQLIQSMDKEYNAQVEIGKMAPEWGGDNKTFINSINPLNPGWWDFYTTAVARGNERWQRQGERKAMENSHTALNTFKATFSEDQRQALNNPDLIQGIRVIMEDTGAVNSRAKGGVIGDARTQIKALTQGTPLEGADSTKLIDYAAALGQYEQREEAYDLRAKAIALIPQTEGMQIFQSNQQALKDASWQAKAARAGVDILSAPLDVMFNSTLESIVSQPISTAATAALFAIPGGQAVAGARFLSPTVNATRLIQGTGSGLIAGIADSSYTYTQELDAARQDSNGNIKPMSEVLSDPYAMRAVNDSAWGHGVAVGTAQGMVGYVLPGIMNPLDRRLAMGAYNKSIAGKPAGTLGGTLAFNAAEIGVQGASEVAGELGGQILQAKDPNIGEIMLEVAGMGGDVLSMYQAPKHLQMAGKNIKSRASREEIAAGLLAKAKEDAVNKAATAIEAVVEEAQDTRGIYARNILPQIEMGTPDSQGMADFHAFYEEDDLEAIAPPESSEAQGLQEPIIEAPDTTPQAPADETSPAPVTTEEVVTEEIETPATSAEPIQEFASLQEGQEISYLSPEGEVRSGPVENLDTAKSEFTVGGQVQSFTPNKFFNGILQPKSNARKLEQGDVLFDGDTFYKYDGEEPADFIVGNKRADGKIQFDKNERRELDDGFVNDPRVSIYSKPDFDGAQQEYNGRADATPEDRFTDILSRTPQKQEPASAPTPEPPAAPVTEGGETKAPATPDVNTPVLSAPITKKQKTIFRLRAHKDVGTVLGKMVDRLNDWMTKTKIIESSPDRILYAKDGKITELFRTQAPETFDETVNALTKEDQDFRNYTEPTQWNQVDAYRKLEVALKERIKKTAKSTNKDKKDRGVLEDAQVSSILQALFVKDKNTAARMAVRFGLFLPNASLVTVEDIAELRYGKAGEWKLRNEFGNMAGVYSSLARLVQLNGNANIATVLHELDHDFLLNIAPLILTTGQYTKLQQLIEKKLASKEFRTFLKENGYRRPDKKMFKEEDFTFFNTKGNLTIPAQEAFTQMMEALHFNGRAINGLPSQDQAILNEVSGYYQQLFQDLGRTPLATLSDDAHDLFSNFFLTPPSLRKAAFTPEARKDRIDVEIVQQDMDDATLAAIISGEIDAPEGWAEAEPQLPAPPQTTGDKIAEDFRLGGQPREGTPFNRGGRNYVIEDGAVFEIINGPLGVQKIPREIEEVPWDGQDIFPQEVKATETNGATDITDENIAETSAPEASTMAVRKVLVPQENGRVREMIIDPSTGRVISNRLVPKKKPSKKKAKTWEPAPIEPVDSTTLVAPVEAEAQPAETTEIAPLVTNGVSGPSASEEDVQQAIETIRGENKASTSVLQRRLRWGYTRSAQVIDILEARGIVGPGEGAKPREILNLPDLESGPDENTLYSIEPDAKYQRGRMNLRILNKQAVSKTLKAIAKENLFPTAPRQVVMDLVEARMNSFVGMRVVLDDIGRLGSMNENKRSRIFDPEDKYKGIGNASFTYYMLAVQSKLNLIAQAQEDGQDLVMDSATVSLYMRSIHNRLMRMQREVGRAVDISRNLLTFSPATIVETLVADTIHNNKAFKNYIRKCLAFGQKYQKVQLTDDEFRGAMQEMGISPIFEKPLRLYARSKDRTSIKDLEDAAAIEWAKDPNLPGHIKPETKILLKELATRSQNASYDWLRDFYAQRAQLLIEAERGGGIIDALLGQWYNNVLVAGSVLKINVVGFWPQYFLNIITDTMAWMALDARNGVSSWKDMNKLPAIFQKNVSAAAAGMTIGAQQWREAKNELYAITMLGQRGSSVEALERGVGTISSNQVWLFGRPGTSYADRTKVTTQAKRMAATVLLDSGRRVATAPDAPYKLLGEYTYLGALLYKEAWNTYEADGLKSDRGKFIADYIDRQLNVQPLAFYQALAQKEIDEMGPQILATSVSGQPRPVQLDAIKKLIAFNLRREAREDRITESVVEDAKRAAFKNTFSNDPRGIFALINTLAQRVNTLGGATTWMGDQNRTWLGPNENNRLRLYAGSSIPIIPFGGNMARMMENFAAWTPLGVVNSIWTNARASGKTNINKQDIYTQAEIAGNMVRGTIGTAAVWGVALALSGGDDDEKEGGMTGHRSKDVFGRNGKNMVVPGYSFWWRDGNGGIGWVEFKEHPALLATFGIAATMAEMDKEFPDEPWIGHLFRPMSAMAAASTQTGAYQSVMDLATWFKGFDDYKGGEKIGPMIEDMLAQNAKMYLIPLNRLQKEAIVYERLAGYDVLPGRGYEARTRRGDFWATFLANTMAEGMLSDEIMKNVDKQVNDMGQVKNPDLLFDRLGGYFKNPPASAKWIADNKYFINRLDSNRSIAAIFPKSGGQQDQAEALFAKMNNGMFYIEHAPEIEKKASEYYWPWLDAYSVDQERKFNLELFAGSKTNQLNEAQGKGLDMRDMQQQDINAIVTAARNIASLQVSAEYYTDDLKVKAWVNAIAAKQAEKGYDLPKHKVNERLEAREALPE